MPVFSTKDLKKLKFRLRACRGIGMSLLMRENFDPQENDGWGHEEKLWPRSLQESGLAPFSPPTCIVQTTATLHFKTRFVRL